MKYSFVCSERFTAQNKNFNGFSRYYVKKRTFGMLPIIFDFDIFAARSLKQF